MVLDEDQNLSVGFVHNRATAHKSLSYHDFGSPCLTPVFASTQLDSTPDGQDCTINCHQYIRESAPFMNLLDIELRFIYEGFKLAFCRMSGASYPCNNRHHRLLCQYAELNLGYLVELTVAVR